MSRGLFLLMKNPDEKAAHSDNTGLHPHEKPWSRGLVTAWALTAYASIALVGGLLLYFFYILLFG